MKKGSRTEKPLLEWHRRAREMQKKHKLSYVELAEYFGKKRSAVYYALHGRELKRVKDNAGGSSATPPRQENS